MLCKKIYINFYENLENNKWKDFSILKYLITILHAVPEIQATEDIHHGLKNYMVAESSSLVYTGEAVVCGEQI